MHLNAGFALRILIIQIIHRVCLLNPLPVDSISRESGSCGNGKYLASVNDATNEQRYYFVEHPQFEANTQYQDSSRTANEGILDRMSKEPIMVKLNVVYDTSLELEFKNGGLENYIRNFIFGAQLVFEQPTLYHRVKVNLVVVSLNKSKYIYTPDMDAVQILEMFSGGSDSNPNADLNVLIVFRNLWERISDGKSKSYLQKKLGLSYPGSFCGSRGTLVVSGSSIGMAVILAHELAHSFNSRHDGVSTSDDEKMNCDPTKFIMSPSNGPEKMYWSTCSVGAMVDHFAQVSTCAYDANRIAGAKPIKDSFDFTLSPSNANRLLLPGKDFPLDLQCSTALDSSAFSSLTIFSRNGRDVYETCKDHVCVLGETEVSIGPAPGGSLCKMTSSWLGSAKWGSCVNATCLSL